MGIKSNEFVTHEISILRTGKNYKVNIKSAIKLTNTIYICIMRFVSAVSGSTRVKKGICLNEREQHSYLQTDYICGSLSFR